MSLGQTMHMGKYLQPKTLSVIMCGNKRRVSVIEFGESKFVGLAGTRGAGKDMGATHLAEYHGFLHVSTGDLIRDVATERGLDHERQTLIDLGIDLRREYDSPAALVIKATELWRDSASRYEGGLAVSGMRSVAEADEVLARGGLLFFIDAQLEIRHRRIAARQRDSEAKISLKEFASRCFEEEYGDNTDVTKANLNAIRKMSHKILRNDYSSTCPYIRELDSALGLSH